MKIKTAFKRSKAREIIIKDLSVNEFSRIITYADVSAQRRRYNSTITKKTNCHANNFTNSINRRKSAIAYQHISMFTNESAEKFIVNRVLKLENDGTKRLTRQNTRKIKLNISNTFK
jgi:hypothetical protein